MANKRTNPVPKPTASRYPFACRLAIGSRRGPKVAGLAMHVESGNFIDPIVG